MDWHDLSDDEEEKYRATTPDGMLAELHHFDYEDSFGVAVDSWRICLARLDADGELIISDQDLEQEGVGIEAAKEWAEPLVREFTERG